MKKKPNTAPEFTDDVDLKAVQEEVAQADEVVTETTKETPAEEEAPANEIAPETEPVEEFPETSELEGTLTVKFIKSGIAFNLSYDAGDVAELPKAQAEFLIKSQFAEIC